MRVTWWHKRWSLWSRSHEGLWRAKSAFVKSRVDQQVRDDAAVEVDKVKERLKILDCVGIRIVQIWTPNGSDVGVQWGCVKEYTVNFLKKKHFPNPQLQCRKATELTVRLNGLTKILTQR